MVAIVYRTDDPVKWGPGKGSNLSPTEIDNNFWEIVQEFASLVSNAAISIDEITDNGDGTLSIKLTDNSIQGPFAIPATAFKWRGTWLPSTTYFRNDLVTTNTGLFLVLTDHVSGTSFAPGSTYQQVFGTPTPTSYHLAANFVGFIPGDRSEVFLHAPAEQFMLPTNLTGSRFVLMEAPATPISFPILKNTTQVGVINFGAAATNGSAVFTADTVFTTGDLLRVLSPDVVDATAKTLVLNLVATVA